MKDCLTGTGVWEPAKSEGAGTEGFRQRQPSRGGLRARPFGRSIGAAVRAPTIVVSMAGGRPGPREE
jgi:hypothetical protein